MKISIIGAGNVGSLTAMRVAEEGFAEVVLIDVVKGLAQGKAFDLEDARPISKLNYKIQGSDDIRAIKDSDIVVITAGLTRKPGMTREDLLKKNAQILEGICGQLKALSPDCIVIVVTNPLDLLTYFTIKSTGFNQRKVLGMGISLDAGRFANLISKELNVSPADVDACVIGSHGEGMIPLPRLTSIKGVTLDEFVDDKKLEDLVAKTVGRGQEIVTLLGSGSAYFAPSKAVAALVKVIAKDEKRVEGVCAYLNGEYGLTDVCLGVPCRLGRGGIEQVIELDLNSQEKDLLLKSAQKLKSQYAGL